jgi:hypothetical protein
MSMGGSMVRPLPFDLADEDLHLLASVSVADGFQGGAPSEGGDRRTDPVLVVLPGHLREVRAEFGVVRRGIVGRLAAHTLGADEHDFFRSLELRAEMPGPGAGGRDELLEPLGSTAESVSASSRPPSISICPRIVFSQ